MNARKLEYIEVNRQFFGRASVRCHVRPRYSGGSPAMVHDHIALQVARDEKTDYERALEGVYGEEQKKRAEVLGLRGTAYAMAEKGSGRNFRWLIYDLVTGEYLRKHADAEIVRMGFTPYAELSAQAKAEINKTGRDSDYERTYWKFQALKWVPYEPEIVRMEDA